jgi:HPt (histidine-containing phosphotransfer) domain-containing protein
MEDLFRRCLGNLALVERVLHSFESHFEDDLDELEAALDSRSFERVAQIAHRMKGASSNVAATALAQELATIEESAREECVSDALDYMDRLRSEWKQFQSIERDFTGCLSH